MTLDKIEYYMEEHVFTYWTKTFFEFTNGDYLKQKQILSKAIKKLENEIESEILTYIKYVAELNLLKHLKV